MDEELTKFVEYADKAYQEVRNYEKHLSEIQTSISWFRSILTDLLAACLREYENSKNGLAGSATLAAWACRNMLELDIFAKYVLIGPANAVEFAQDFYIDATDFYSSFRDFLLLHEPSSKAASLQSIVDSLVAKKSELGITRTHYLSVARMAEVVNFAEEYRRMNKATSKLVHPTAFSVLATGQSSLSDEHRQIFFLGAVRYGVEVYHDIKKHVEQNGLEL
jgi:hypothetical protein